METTNEFFGTRMRGTEHHVPIFAMPHHEKRDPPFGGGPGTRKNAHIICPISRCKKNGLLYDMQEKREKDSLETRTSVEYEMDYMRENYCPQFHRWGDV